MSVQAPAGNSGTYRSAIRMKDARLVGPQRGTAGAIPKSDLESVLVDWLPGDERVEWGRSAASRWARVHESERRTEPSGTGHGCLTWTGCKPDGAGTYCEDTNDNPTWLHSWHHSSRTECARTRA